MKKLAGMITANSYPTKSRTIQRHHLLCAWPWLLDSSSTGIIINIGTTIVFNTWWLTLAALGRCSSHLNEELP